MTTSSVTKSSIFYVPYPALLHISDVILGQQGLDYGAIVDSLSGSYTIFGSYGYAYHFTAIYISRVDVGSFVGDVVQSFEIRDSLNSN